MTLTTVILSGKSKSNYYELYNLPRQHFLLSHCKILWYALKYQIRYLMAKTMLLLLARSLLAHLVLCMNKLTQTDTDRYKQTQVTRDTIACMGFSFVLNSINKYPLFCLQFILYYILTLLLPSIS